MFKIKNALKLHENQSVSTLPSLELLFLLAVAFLARVSFLNVFLIGGDEWATIHAARNLGISHIAYPYFLVLHLVLKYFGVIDPILRFVSILYGILGIFILYWSKHLFRQPSVAFYASLIASFSPYLVMDHLEIRYYSFFFLGSALLLLSYLNYFKNPSRGSLWFSLGMSIFGILFHFNLIFPAAGFILFLFVERGLLGKRGFNVLGFICLIVLGVLVFALREKLFSILATLTYANNPALTADKPAFTTGIVGFKTSSVIKLAFAIYSFIFGYNTNPLDFAFNIPVTVLCLILFFRGIFFLKRREGIPLQFWFYFLAVPLMLLYFVAEPLATAGYKGMVAPKHAVFAYPFFILSLAAGIFSFSQSNLRKIFLVVVIGIQCLGLYRIGKPNYSYYSDRYIDFRKPSEFLSELRLDNTLLVLDPHTKNSFEFYNPDYLKSKTVSTPWKAPDLNLSTESYDHVVFVTTNWKAVTKLDISNRVYHELLEQIGNVYCLEDGFVEFPFFFYIFKHKSFGCKDVVLPVTLHGFEYADLNLPARSGSLSILSSFVLRPQNRIWKSALSQPEPRKGGRWTLIANLEGSQKVPWMSEVGKIEFKREEKVITTIPLVKGLNIFDAFHEYENKGFNIRGNQIAVSWEKQPIISSEHRYWGSMARFKAHLYRIELDSAADQPLSEIEVNFTAPSGRLRIWALGPEKG